MMVSMGSFLFDRPSMLYSLAEVIRNVPIGDGETIDGISDSLLLVDILESVARDGTVMMLVTVVGMLLIALIAFRRPKRIFILFFTIGCAAIGALGWVGLFGVKFNFINMLVVPIWLGLGVDAAFHLMVREEESPGDFNGFIATAVAVSAAFLTSVIGFGSMLVTSHSGLFSMGAIACIGLLAILFISTLVQATLFLRSSS